MPIVVTCPSCATTLKAPDAAAGKKVKCPKCTSTIAVPAAAAPPEEIVEEFIDEPPPAPARRREAEVAAPRDFAPPPPEWVSNRQTVALVALIIPIGALGIHKFILGKTTPGFIMLLVTLFGCGIGYLVMLVIAIMEGIKYMKMSDAEFYDTYVVGDKAWM